MSGSFPALNVQVPDIGRSIMQADAIRANRLQMLAQQQQLEDSQAFRQAAPDLLPALATAEGPQRQNVLAKIAGLGERGAGIALPMMQQDRELSQFQQIMGAAGLGPRPAAPAVGAQPAAPMAPAAPASGGPGANFFTTLARAESGGDPNARNPRSTATGTHQFIDATWRQFAQENPSLFQGMSPEQVMAARTDPVMSLRAAQWYAQRNTRDLSAQGLPVSPATLGLAHGFGAAGAATLLRADPNAPAESVLPPDVMAANPNLRGQTVGQIVQTFQQRFGQGDAPASAPPAPQTAPGQPPQGVAPQTARTGLPTVEQLAVLAASGNPRAAAYVQRMAPLVQQANPSFSFQNIGGRLLAINPQNPSQRLDLGPAGDPPNAQITEIGGRRVAVNPQDPANGQIDLGPAADPNASARDERNRSFSDTRSLREEYNSSQPVKDFSTIRPSFEAIQRAQNVDTRAADIDMVFAFAKMLDPASVVREGEQITLMRTGGVFDTIAGYVSGLTGGGRLTPEVRSNILQQARARYQVAADAHDERLDYYRGLAQENGLNPTQIGRYARERTPGRANAEGDMPRPPQPQAGNNQNIPRAQLNGRTIIVRDGRWVFEDTGAVAQ